MIRIRPVPAALAATILALLGLATASPPIAQAADACSVPTTREIRGKDVDPRIKKQALFWLGQKDDERALALIEEILLKK